MANSNLAVLRCTRQAETHLDNAVRATRIEPGPEVQGMRNRRRAGKHTAVIGREGHNEKQNEERMNARIYYRQRPYLVGHPPRTTFDIASRAAKQCITREPLRQQESIDGQDRVSAVRHASVWRPSLVDLLPQTCTESNVQGTWGVRMGLAAASMGFSGNGFIGICVSDTMSM